MCSIFQSQRIAFFTYTNNGRSAWKRNLSWNKHYSPPEEQSFSSASGKSPLLRSADIWQQWEHSLSCLGSEQSGNHPEKKLTGASAKSDVFSSDTSAIRGDRASRRYSSAEMVQWSAVVVALLAVICVAAAVIDSAEPVNKAADNDDYLVKQVIIICIQLHDVNVIHTIIIYQLVWTD